MIVQSHSPEQVVQEALHDLPALWNKMKDPIARLQRRMRVDKSLRMVPQLHAYRSPEGEQLARRHAAHEEGAEHRSFVWYRGTDGYYRAARIVQDGCATTSATMCWSNTSDRFNRTIDGLTRLKEFLRENMCFGTEYCSQSGEVRVGVTQGYIIGTWVVPHRWRSHHLRGPRQVVQRATGADGALGPTTVQQHPSGSHPWQQREAVGPSADEPVAYRGLPHGVTQGTDHRFRCTPHRRKTRTGRDYI
ncbi:MAG: hypothetical protein IPN85_15130 [Flavobacteriales bacterium]|nr:hypothetical protein [Flavobacteriales bacterium]